MTDNLASRGLNAYETRILDALAAGPLSARELSDRLRLEVLNEWADEHGYEIEWDSDSEPVGARILAISGARERGTYAGLTHEVDTLLRSLEKRGLVERIQMEGHRPMLWRRA